MCIRRPSIAVSSQTAPYDTFLFRSAARPIIEKFHAWTDHDGNLPTTLTRDDMLDNVMLYWLTNSGTSSARLYWGNDKNCA